LDALAIAVAYWTESMARDNNKAATEIKSAAMDKELKNWHKNVFGVSERPQTTWMSRA
jgi:hypothetical protein